jgi:hypothetical protein
MVEGWRCTCCPSWCNLIILILPKERVHQVLTWMADMQSWGDPMILYNIARSAERILLTIREARIRAAG